MDHYTALGTQVSVLTTQLDALANGGFTALSSVVSNDAPTTERMKLGMIEVFINTQGSNRSVGAYVGIYFVPTADGTNYGRTTGNAITNYMVAELAIDDTALASGYLIAYNIPLPPTDFKIAAGNFTGQALAGSGNTVKFTPYSSEDV